MSGSHVHTANKQPYAEEEEYGAAASTAPVLHYWPVRGRAEPIRLVLAYKQQRWFEAPIEPLLPIYRLDLDDYTFRALPRFVDEVNGKIDSVQSMAILRHLGRKFDMYGGSGAQQEALIANLEVDRLIEGCQDLREQLKELYVGQHMAPEAKARYRDTVLAEEGRLTDQLRDWAGPGIACLDHYLRVQAPAAGASNGWFVGSAPTLADVVVFDVVDLHRNYFNDIVCERFPALVAHAARFEALLGVREYLESTTRHRYVWVTDWYKEHLATKAAGDAAAAVEGAAE